MTNTQDCRRRLPVVFVQRPACPRCGHRHFRVRSSREERSGTQRQYCRCRRCEQPFIIVKDFLHERDLIVVTDNNR